MTAPKISDPWDDARITAYVLGDMSPEEASIFESQVSRQESLALAVDRAKQIVAQVSAFYDQDAVQALDPARRRDLLQTPQWTSTPAANPADARSRWIRFVVAVAVAFVGVGLWVMLPNLPGMQNAPFRVAAKSDSFESRTPGDAKRAAEVAAAPVAEMPVAAPAAAAPAAASPAPAASPEPEIAPAFGARTYLGVTEDSAFRSTDPRDLQVREAQTPLRAAMSSRQEKTEKTYDRPQALWSEASPVDLGSEVSRMNLEIQPLEKQSDSTEFDFDAMQKDVSQGTGPGLSGDQFDVIDENQFQRVSEHPLSTFSIDVDTASYSKVRDFLIHHHQLPRRDAVRIEEMINYFDYDYEAPSPGDESPFRANLASATCPWNPDHRLLRVGIQAKRFAAEERPRCNLVFLIDTSGSMQESRKLPLVIQGLKLLLQNLRKDDRVAIVVYAGAAGLVLDSTPIREQEKINRALAELSAGGSTNGGAGLQLAYATAREHFIPSGVNRVILCSDGDFNVGMTGTDQLVDFTKTQSAGGIELTVLGFGMGNHQDAMMEQISQSGSGNYAYVDSLAEAHKVLADQLTGTLVTVAHDVKIQIEFNPATVAAYRLIGYENRLLAKEDFNDDTQDAGEIGAGHRVTALYEVVPLGMTVDVIAPSVDALKYQKPPASDPVASQEMLTLKIRHKPSQGGKSRLNAQSFTDRGDAFEMADADFRFAAAVAGFGMQLRSSKFAGTWTLDEVLKTATEAIGPDAHGLRAEFLTLVQAARRATLREE